MSDNGFEFVESRRMKKVSNNDNGPVVVERGNKVVDKVVDNFENILSLAGDIVEIKKMQVQSDAILAKMKEDRENLLAEAKAYAERKNADTNSVVEKMKVIQSMMKEFYQFNNSNMSGEDFSRVISEIVTQMGRID
ncbi:hypothetical protein [Clostridium folliculivorans]|uniref:Uncharacterized protein n=1 Tax=Clostridium folliculivorans TaxID=2886038 RepID=A0A9W5Y251_9CLOT|nr:hypothetical protein [Clostridium folliculivorans]GKU25196.1 hypothetical protein CFOLD11_20220 [Clostridium folliculivorans]GKU31294.1 hypothetical protein CFB3_34010 [Clostridium folliculivorans]